MDELELRALIAEVKASRFSRRRFIHTMVGLGLTAPMAAQIGRASCRERVLACV